MHNIALNLGILGVTTVMGVAVNLVRKHTLLRNPRANAWGIFAAFAPEPLLIAVAIMA